MSQVSDYNIANASGASVRSDLNAVLDAIKTLNSGGSNPSNTEAFMPYVDTADSNNLKIRNAANDAFVTVGSIDSANLGLLPRAGGTMTGQILGDEGGGANTPAYAFDGDVDTGMFWKSANTIGFTTSGVERFIVDSTGITLQNRRDVRFSEASSNGTNYIGLQAPSSVSSNVIFSLPGADGTNGQMLQTNGSGALSFTTVQGVPSGAVFCIAVATIPSGYLECNGAAVSRTTYAALFAIIGTQYGAGDGSSTFNIPDLRGEFVRGYDHGRGTDSGRNIASNQSSQNKEHDHSVSLSGTTSNKSLTGNIRKISEGFRVQGSASGVFSKTNDGNNSVTGSSSTSPVSGVDFDASHTHTFSVSGDTGSQGSESRPRNVAMMYVIKI